jgi:hypothetical protein
VRNSEDILAKVGKVVLKIMAKLQYSNYVQVGTLGRLEHVKDHLG